MTTTFTLQSLAMPGYIDVKGVPFNATGDGVTDDRVAIQAAITAATNLGGCILHFPPGTYIVSRTGVQAYSLLCGGDNIMFRGVRHMSWLSHPTGMPNSSVAVVELDRCENVTFRDIGISGNWGNAMTVVSENSTSTALPQATINVVDTTGFPAGPSTINVQTTSGMQAVTYTAKTATSFTGCAGGVGTMMRNYAVIYVNDHTGINQTSQADPKNYLIIARGGKNLLIEDCDFKQCYGDFVWLGASNIDHTNWPTNTRIINCTGDISARNGVTFGSAVDGCVIDRCYFTNIFQQAVDGEPQAYPVRNIDVTNNYLGGWPDPTRFANGCAPLSIVGGDQNGFTTLGAAAWNWRVLNNYIAGTVFIEYAQDVVFQGNHVVCDWGTQGASAVQIMLGAGDISILDNYIYSRATNAGGGAEAGAGLITVYNYASGVRFFNPPNVQIRGNKLHNRNGKHAINLFAPGGAVQTASGVATAVTVTTLTLAGAGWTVDAFGGCMVRVGTAEAAILSNTADTLTLGLVDNSTTSAWQTDQGNYAPTPAATNFLIFRLCGVIDVDSNDIDGRNDGNGVGGYGVRLTMGNGNPGMRVRIHDNKIKNCGTDGINVPFAISLAIPMALLDISDNFGMDDQPTPTMTNLITYVNAPNVTKWVMRGNMVGEGVTAAVNGLSAGQWLLNDGNTQQWAGYGDPLNVVTAPIGSIFQRIDGGAGTSFYVKEANTGAATGWVAK